MPLQPIPERLGHNILLAEWFLAPELSFEGDAHELRG